MKRTLILLVVFFMLAIPAGFAADEAAHGGAETAEAGHEVATEHEGAAAEHGGEHESKTYFGIPGGILKFLNLAAFIGLLVYLLKKPIQNAFTNRRETIQKQLVEADERRKKADSLAEDIQERLSQIEKEVDAILERAREEGERQKKEMLAAAEAEAAKILSTARSQIDQRVSHARRELTDYAGELAAAKAQSMIESSINEQDRATVFNDSVERIGDLES